MYVPLIYALCAVVLSPTCDKPTNSLGRYGISMLGILLKANSLFNILIAFATVGCLLATEG
jgi:hypothetical protein